MLKGLIRWKGSKAGIAPVISLSIFLAGCSGVPSNTENDFTYEDINDFSEVGVVATSQATGKTIEASASCTDEARRYVISRKSASPYGGAGDEWTISIGGEMLFAGQSFYEDEAAFRAAVSAIELVGPKGRFGGQPRMRVSNPQMERIPELCKEKQAQVIAYIRDAEENGRIENERLISDVTSRTGAEPMLPGRNQMDFNNLVLLFQQTGASKHQGKFVWAADGDYRVAQVIGDKALLVSMTNPALFPAITIISDKQVLEGQFWSSVSRGPLQMIGISNYQTILNVSRQTILFKEI